MQEHIQPPLPISIDEVDEVSNVFDIEDSLETRNASLEAEALQAASEHEERERTRQERQKALEATELERKREDLAEKLGSYALADARLGIRDEHDTSNDIPSIKPKKPGQSSPRRRSGRRGVGGPHYRSMGKFTQLTSAEEASRNWWLKSIEEDLDAARDKTLSGERPYDPEKQAASVNASWDTIEEQIKDQNLQ